MGCAEAPGPLCCPARRLLTLRVARHTVVTPNNRIDVLVNNAGRGQRALVEETALEVDRALFEVRIR